MKKLKLITIVGTRPEIIKLSAFIPLADEYLDHVLVHTGQNYDYELNEIFFEQLNIRKPDFFLDANRESFAETTSDIIKKIDKIYVSEDPDAILIYGDTNSCLSVIPAKRRKIPIFHMEAGNRCFDQRVPEEINRKIVDHLSDINMPISEHARRYLINEGIKPETIIKVGSSMPEVFKKNEKKINDNNILKKESLEKNKYFLVSIHREENIDSEENFLKILKAINSISEKYKLPILISTHPRTKKRLDEIDYFNDDELIRFVKPLGFHEYNKLQMNSFCVLSDSGTIAEEASILNFSSINLRESNERPEAYDEGVCIMSGLDEDSIINSITLTTSLKKNNLSFNQVQDYQSENTSLKVLKTIFSYHHFVNRKVWFR
jgi:UDP-N-acetylglucosamine 2-epimerase (non-hydrolysing)